MNKLIKSATIFKAELPSADALAQHIAASEFKPLAELDWHGSGFVNIPATRELVSTFEGGIAFAVRFDSKILPPSIIRAEALKKASAREQAEHRKVSRKELREIIETTADELLKKALTKTAIITCYYDTKNQFLIIPSSSNRLADVCIHALVHAVSSIKTTTIHISDVKLGLTTKLQQWLNADNDAFGQHFMPRDKASLHQDKDKTTFDMNILENATPGLLDAMSKGFTVTELGMMFDGKTTFRLTKDFQLKGIKFDYTPGEAEDQHEAWAQDASIQLLEISALINALCELLSYKAPAETKQAA